MSTPAKHILVISDGIYFPPCLAKLQLGSGLPSPFSCPNLHQLLITHIRDTPKISLRLHNPAACIVCIKDKQRVLEVTSELRQAFKLECFVCVFHPDATEDARLRQDCFLPATNPRCNMVTCFEKDLEVAFERIFQCLEPTFIWSSNGQPQHTHQSSNLKLFTCPTCGARDLSEDGLWLHTPLYHTNHQNVDTTCCICRTHCKVRGEPFAVHLRNKHGPCARGLVPPEERTGIFSVAVCRRPSDGKFLMVQEFANVGFWVVGGQVERGETCREGLIREALEEAGVQVEVKGTLEFAAHGSSWRRVIFYCEPVAGVECTPKTVPDYESTGAVWVGVDELPTLKLRGESEVSWFKHVAGGGVISPLEIPSKYQDKFRGVTLL